MKEVVIDGYVMVGPDNEVWGDTFSELRYITIAAGHRETGLNEKELEKEGYKATPAKLAVKVG